MQHLGFLQDAWHACFSLCALRRTTTEVTKSSVRKHASGTALLQRRM